MGLADGQDDQLMVGSDIHDVTTNYIFHSYITKYIRTHKHTHQHTHIHTVYMYICVHTHTSRNMSCIAPPLTSRFQSEHSSVSCFAESN